MRILAAVATGLSVVLVTVFGLGVVMASADQIDDAITNVQVREDSADRWDSVHVDIDWAVSDSAASGDTFTLTLPPELDATADGFDLKSPDGETVATAEIVDDVATFTLTGYADSHDNVAGTAYFTSKFNQDEIDFNADNPVTFTVNDTTEFTDSVYIGAGVIDRGKSRKFGFWSEQDERAMWGVEAVKGPWPSVTITDTVGAGMAMDCDSVAVESSAEWNEVGELQNVQAVSADRYEVVSCTADELVLRVDDVAQDEVIRMYVAADVSGDPLDEYTNKAVVAAGSESATVSGSLPRSDAGGDGGGDTPTTEPTTTEPTTTEPTTTEPTTTATEDGPVAESDTPTPMSSSGDLAVTGLSVAPVAIIGLLAVATGGGLLLLLRRRTRADRR